MNISAPFIARPVATTLLTLGIALAGAVAFFLLPVSPLPQVDFPTIMVQANLPGASPETVATSVATPLERHLGQIAGVTEMTSQSSVGSTRIVLQFDLSRNIDGAARDVQAAINAARADLPASLRSNPTYRKVNPADAPIMILSLTSDTLTLGQIYDSASNVLEQKLSQVAGIGQVTLGGSSLPAVRVELNPYALFHYGIGLEDVRAAIAATNANSPKGHIDVGDRRYQLYTNDQASQAAQYQSLIVAYRDGAPVRLSDVAEVENSVEDVHNRGIADGKPAVLVILFRQPGANIIDTVDGVKALLPQLNASMPSDIKVQVASDRTVTIRASLHDIEHTLMLSTVLVVLVVFLFLRSARATLIPSVAVPVSLLGTFGVMYLLGFSLDNLSLMALTVATGFVVDDAVVVLENVARHMENGMPRMQAALVGAREVGFTVLSMSLSLVAVFLPLLLMAGMVGRLFSEFAITLSIAILVSLVVSLTTTPLMCSRVLAQRAPTRHGRFYRASEWAFERLLEGYRSSLTWALGHAPLILLVFFATIVLNVYLFVVVPKGFFPQQDTGRLTARLHTDDTISFQALSDKLAQFMEILRKDPAVDSAVGFSGGGRSGASVYLALKPKSERESLDRIMMRMRRELSHVPGAQLYLQPVQDIRVGGRQSNATYQYTLQGDNLDDLRSWTGKLVAALQGAPALVDVNSDLEAGGLEANLVVDRDTASRLGLSMSQINNTLYDAFGQRQVSVIYSTLNQYHVVMEVAPQYRQEPGVLDTMYVGTGAGAVSGTAGTAGVTSSALSAPATGGQASSATSSTSAGEDVVRNERANQLGNTGRGGISTGSAVSTSRQTMIPLSAFSRYEIGTTPISVNHEGLFAASTISFNLAPGRSLGDASAEIERAADEIHMPESIQGGFAGTAELFQQALSNQPLLIGAALLTIYIVLGMLYESTIHPITILSTLPPAGIGAVLALLLFNTEFTLIALIGVFLLIGIVKKNAIMMIDFALAAEREQRLTPHDAILQACLLRFRPILMTTFAALFGALPLAVGTGEGAELRQPLGISIIGGLIVSQLLTLYTTPVIYLYLDRLRNRVLAWRARRHGGALSEHRA